ncbi:conserved hypothetical protein [Hyella patelloides LEGE 07179]|uniref:YprB ribonuclease H-like domain-containing protein n=1 Tax=Hyella patelloides LEGE 07179 TaxID=945734 RepID=A0A563VQ65_9CYAN|nr:TM0106 family RecB-like putative nuclease [Hyella patelloides]VEP13505.1 conserved hypothetical protein [Hyella patelloides LEGE 07179]
MIILTDELLLNYKRCSRRTYLEVYGSHEQKDPKKEFLLKLRKENQQHIQNFIQERSLNPQKPTTSFRDWSSRYEETLALMKQGVDCIFKGVLCLNWEDWQKGITNEELKPISPPTLTISSENTIVTKSINHDLNLNPDRQEITLLANPTLLIKQPGKSVFGDWSYVPISIKLGRRPKPEYKLIGAYHAQMLAIVQDAFPVYSSLILRQQNEYYVNLSHWLDRTQEIVANCLEMLSWDVEPEVFISRQKCSLCHWYSHCYQIAKNKQHLSLIPGVTPKRYNSLKEMGLDDLDLIASSSDRILGRRIGQDVAKQLQQQARSLLLNTPLIKANYDLDHSYQLPSSAIELYFDIEAEPDRNLDYLLGILLVDNTNNTKKFYPFLAEKAEEEERVWREFFEFITDYPHAPIFHFSAYEVDTIKRLARLYGTPKIPTKALVSRCVDLHYWVTKSVILPVESYSLKSLANWLGFEWREETASGDQSVCWYDNWLTTQDRSLLEAILNYNEDDCYATYYLKDWLVKFFSEAQKHQAL